MRTLIASVLFAAACVAAESAFEVASVKAVKLGDGGREGEGPNRNIQTSPGNLTMRNVSLIACIKWAYDLSDFQIEGPDWIAFDRFEIVAKADGPATSDQMKPMLRTLLAERFKLAFHRSRKVLPVYAMVVAKGGPKLRESEGTGDPFLSGGKANIIAQRMTMPVLADMLSKPLQKPVVDATGLTGRYDFTLDLTSSFSRPSTESTARDDVPGIIMTGVQEQLGLKMESRKSPVMMFIIDHVEKAPAAN